MIQERGRRLALQDLPLRQGDPFNRFAMQASADSITRRLRDHGFPSARVFSSFASDKEADTASVTLDVDPGRRAVIGPVRVVGATRVDSSLVRKLLVSRTGRRYSQEELFQSQRNLYESDLFRFATVNIDSTNFQPGADSVPLVVQVNEGKRRRIRGGIGYATNDCFRGSLGWTSRNFLGAGRILDVTSRVSKVGVGRPLDWGLAQDLCGASRDDTVGSAKLNYYLGTSIRRPAFLSPNNALTLTVVLRAALRVQGLSPPGNGCQCGADPHHPSAAHSPVAHVHAVVRADRGHTGKLLCRRSMPVPPMS